jgi:hypothetical protein
MTLRSLATINRQLPEDLRPKRNPDVASADYTLAETACPD